MYQDNKIENIFRDACRTGNTLELGRAIRMKMFDVNLSLYTSIDVPPLFIAISKRSVPVVTLLLENGADPNANDGWALNEAIATEDLELVRLLLDKGADPNPQNGKLLSTAVGTGQLDIVELLLDRVADIASNLIQAIDSAIPISLKLKSLEMLDFLWDRAIQLLENPDIDEKTLMIGKYSRLCLAIIDGDHSQISEILEDGDYESYAGIVDGRCCRPTCLAFRFSRIDMLKYFLEKGVAVTSIFVQAAFEVNLELVEMCAKSPGFDPHASGHFGLAALHSVFSQEQYDISRVLMSKFGLTLNDRCATGHTPVFFIRDLDILRSLLQDFPDTDLNIISNNGDTLLSSYYDICEQYALYLELGVDPKLPSRTDSFHECDEPNCAVIQYLQKLLIVDSEYVESLLNGIVLYPINLESFKLIDSLHDEEYQLEIVRMQSLRISQSTMSVPGKNLFDFIFFEPNAAARYSKNEIVLKIYEENERNFQKVFPHYGFALNRQLRRGQVRSGRIESAGELIRLALGTNHVPEDFSELVFGNFNNRDLERYNLETTID